VADDFVENLAAFACELAVHRAGTKLEAKDIQLALGALPHLRTNARWDPLDVSLLFIPLARHLAPQRNSGT
jgi:hypothetical protein